YFSSRSIFSDIAAVDGGLRFTLRLDDGHRMVRRFLRKSRKSYGDVVLHEIHLLPRGVQARRLYLGAKSADGHHRGRFVVLERLGSRRLRRPKMDVDIERVPLARVSCKRVPTCFAGFRFVNSWPILAHPLTDLGKDVD